MTIYEISEKIAISLDTHCDEKWRGILDNSDPSPYCVDELEFRLDPKKDIRVNVPERNFTFKDGTLSFSVRLGSSSPEHGVDRNISKVVSGSGTFDFEGATAVKVLEFKINETIDLFEN